MKTKKSPQALRELMAAIEEDGVALLFSMEGDEAQGATDCPEGCTVEPDGTCSHGWLSAALSGGLV